MIHAQSKSKKTGLLVSVRNAEEALIAAESNCVSIIDLKEPTAGSLGSVLLETASMVLDILPSDCLSSIALGEVIDWPCWSGADIVLQQEVLSQFDFAKLGLSGLADDAHWIQRWKDALAQIPDGVNKVAVAYADSDRACSPAVEAVIESASEVGCSVLLIDTFSKQDGGLLDIFTLPQLTGIACTAWNKGLKVVLAGSLDFESIEAAKTVNPDFIAVRGAACSGDRTSKIEAEKIQRLAGMMNIPSQ